MSIRERIRELLLVVNGFRKLTLMAVLVIVGVVFRVLDYISGAELVELLKNTTVAYMAGNGIEHMTNAVKEWLKKKVEK